MKNLSVNRVAALLGLLLCIPALASEAREGLACLDRYDIACAQKALEDSSSGTEADFLRAQLEFHLGNFDSAAEAIGKLESEMGSQESFKAELGLYRKTASATAGFQALTRDDITLQYLPGVDQVMLDEAFETLAAARTHIGARLGGTPPGGIRMEIYPSIQRFTDASGLPPSAVRTTGVIALSKWTRLLLTSPRALGKGYAWKDTVAHEYTHYIVAWRTQDRAPVWLQEGIARSHELFWRGDNRFELSPNSQSLLAEALQDDSFVPLEKMHPSIAFLPSAREAALAYAQVSTMMVYLEQVAGRDAVSRVLDKVRDGATAEQAVADVGAGGDMDAFLAGWKTMLRGMGLIQQKLAAMPTAVDPGQNAYDLDPLLAQRKDLASHARLGDLLLERNHPQAALVEYQRAMPPDEPPSPMVSVKMAEALGALGRAAEALSLLKRSVEDYPEYAETRTALAKLLAAAGNRTEALAQYRASADIDPFDSHVQAALADLYAATGNARLAERHAGYRRILEAGGLPLETR
jgi:tetratricopeptide (TPR) repeat protein